MLLANKPLRFGAAPDMMATGMAVTEVRHLSFKLLPELWAIPPLQPAQNPMKPILFFRTLKANLDPDFHLSQPTLL